MELFIKGINIDWSKISERSYLRGIEAVSQISELSFSKPVTFFCRRKRERQVYDP